MHCLRCDTAVGGCIVIFFFSWYYQSFK